MMNNKFLLIPLILSFLFFIRKAAQYALLGSYIPLLIVAVFLLLILITLKYNRKVFVLASKTWAILIIIWSSVRILISIINYSTNTFDEYHLNHQFGILRIGLSLIMLLLGIMIIRHTHSKRLKKGA